MTIFPQLKTLFAMCEKSPPWRSVAGLLRACDKLYGFVPFVPNTNQAESY